MAKIQDIDIPYLEFAEAAAPGTPASAISRIYVKADGLFYSKDDAGTETLMSSGPAGGSVATDAIWDAAGDLVQGTGANTAAKLSAGTARQVLTSQGAAAANIWAGADTLGYIHLRDQKAANTAGGGFTSGSYQTRVLNTEVTDLNNDCTLASNQITLAAGTYQARITAPAWLVNSHKARLYNVTDAATVLVGTTEYGDAAGGQAQTCSIIVGRFTIAASKALEVQHQAQTTRATNGFGVAANMTEVEVYTIVELWRIS